MGNTSNSKPSSSQNRSQSSRKRSKFSSFRRRKSKQTKSDPVKLYINKPNASCRMVWLYCVENDVPFELQFVDERRGDTATEEFHSLNPHESVPVLKDGDVVLYESIAILYYIASSHTGFAGFGKTIQEKSAVGSLCCWACKTLTKAVAYHFVFPQFVDAYKLDTPEANTSLIGRGRAEVSACLDTLQNEYLTRPGHDYLLGANYTLADTCVATVLTLLESVSDFDWDPWPKVSAWMEKVKARPKWEEVNENHVRYVEKLEMRQKEGFSRRIHHVASTMYPLDDKDVEEEEEGKEVANATSTENEVRAVVHTDGEAKSDKDGEVKTDKDGEVKTDKNGEVKSDKDGEVKSDGEAKSDGEVKAEEEAKAEASSGDACKEDKVPQAEDSGKEDEVQVSKDDETDQGDKDKDETSEKGDAKDAVSQDESSKKEGEPDETYEPKAEGEEAKAEESTSEEPKAEPEAKPEQEEEKGEKKESKDDDATPISEATEKADAEEGEKKEVAEVEVKNEENAEEKVGENRIEEAGADQEESRPDESEPGAEEPSKDD